MNAQELLGKLTAYMQYFLRYKFDCELPQYVPRRTGPFGNTETDRWAQFVTIGGEKFLVTVEKSPNQ